MSKPQPGYESLAYLVKPSADGRLGLEWELPRPTANVRDFRNEQAANKCRWTLEVDGKTVAAVLFLFDPDDQEVAHVIGVYTKRGHRRRGYASDLVEAVRKRYPKLSVDDDRSAAGRALCAALGY